MPYLEALLGYRTRPHLNKTISRYAMGINLNIKGIKLSYAYEKSKTPVFDNIHYVSFSIFNTKQTTKPTTKHTTKHKPIQKKESQRISQSKTLIKSLTIHNPRVKINPNSTVHIKKTRTKMGISGHVGNIKTLFINNTKVYVRPNSKFYIIMPLPQEDIFEFKFKAIGIEGTEKIKIITFKRED